MNDRNPTHIICAVRSRPGGEETVQKAIDLALESGAKLTFLQVVDLEFLARIGTGHTSSRRLAHELREMTDFTMALLCDQAELQGVQEVESVVREGRVREQLLNFVAETDAGLLVLGRSRPDTPGPDVFDRPKMEAFVRELERVGSLRVVVG